ncbi:MAG TPA: glycosyltransferase, partial [Stellaceae bacterium]|nr:glycosyltransferase [Stellaceae bacterium]
DLPPQDMPIDISIVMPCLNEAKALGACISNARGALTHLREKHGLSGEIIVADNGSSDGSQQIAFGLGARVVAVPRRGYGAALIGGFAAARGRFLVMGDADGSYDFGDAVAMVEALIDGADLCMGSRFKGGIKLGAMPWKNRYIGNPALTAVLNVFFHAGVSDAHCGLRALTKSCFERLKLNGFGMEFASEMVIKAALLGERIVEVPATLSPDLRGRPPHLRPWRDGWRHLRYLLMLSPSWVFAIPAGLGTLLAFAVLLPAAEVWIAGEDQARLFFGNYWVILAGSVLDISHIAAVLALACHLYGIREGFRKPGPWTAALSRWLTLETMLLAGLLAMISGLGILLWVFAYWSAHDFGRIASVFPAVAGTSLLTMGIQNMLGGFLLAIVGGNEAQFLARLARWSLGGQAGSQNGAEELKGLKSPETGPFRTESSNSGALEMQD